MVNFYLSVFSVNTSKMELSDLKKVICSRKSDSSVEKIQFVKCLKNQRTMAYNVCHASLPMMS